MTSWVWHVYGQKRRQKSLIAGPLIASALGAFSVIAMLCQQAMSDKVLAEREQVEFLVEILLGAWALTFGTSMGGMMVLGTAIAETLPRAWLEPLKSPSGQEMVPGPQTSLPDASFAFAVASTRSQDMGRMTRAVWRFFQWKGCKALIYGLSTLAILTAFVMTAFVLSEASNKRALAEPEEIMLLAKVLLGACVFTFGLSLSGILSIGRALVETLPPQWLEQQRE